MKRSYLAAIPALALMFATLFGCDSGNNSTDTEKAGAEKTLTKASAEKKLIGKWKFDTRKMKEAMMAELENQPADAPNAEMAAAMIEGMISQMEMTFEFLSDGKILITQNTSADAQTDENTWEITSVDNGRITVVVDEEPAYVTFVGNDVLELTPPEEGELPPGMSSLRFNRIKE